MGEHVPIDFKKRNDFVLRLEMREICTGVGDLLSQDLKDLLRYYSVNIAKCKWPKLSYFLEYAMETVDISEFYKLMIDFIVHSDL